MISLGYYCSTRHFFTTYCFNCACVDRTTPTYCKILPIILGIILNSFVHLLFSKLCRNNLSSPSIGTLYYVGVVISVARACSRSILANYNRSGSHPPPNTSLAGLPLPYGVPLVPSPSSSRRCCVVIVHFCFALRCFV